MNSLYNVGHIYVLWLFLLTFSPNLLFAQPANDDCANAIFLENLDNFCSDDGAYTSVRATPNPDMTASTCAGENGRDVWFKFTPLQPNITITVIGETGGNFPGGTLNNPLVELYFNENGDCSGDFRAIECGEDENGSGTATINKGGLIPGTEYFIKVQGINNRAGTFQLCINNYTPPFPPESDCDKANLLCDKSTFFIEKIVGAGDDPDEAAGTCLGNCDVFSNSESSSTWYKWIAATSGSLTFTLTPENPEDDLDFALYELPGGIDDCGNKELLRCLASGENRGQPFFNWERCTGATGIRINDGDGEETCGCQSGDNNFAEAINMEEGKTYALLINNFSESEDGFTISFGGTGEFLGPTPNAEFLANNGDFCAGAEITFSGVNSSFQLGAITDYRWSFGNGAEPAVATGAGPHTVTYETPGEKNVLLTVETDLGCVASDKEEAIVVIETCCETKNGIVADGEKTDAICLGDRGSIDVEASSLSPITSYQWSNNENTQDISGLPSDDYMVTITNLATCEEVLSFTVDSLPPFQIGTELTRPTCNGGMDGAITINISGATAEPVLIDFGNGFSDVTSMTNLSVGDYMATVRDTNGCLEDIIIPLNELELELDSSFVTIQDPTCYNFSNGRIAINISNGLPEYFYDWNDGNGMVNTNSLNNIPAGIYSVDVTDRNLCKGAFEFVVNGPDELTLVLDTINVSCQGAADGTVTAIVEGGTGDYNYTWSNMAITEQIMNLEPGNYSLVVLDENDCEVTQTATVTEPSTISIAISDVQDAICFGDNTGVISVMGIGGNANYEFSVDGTNFQQSPDLTGLAAGDYTVFVRDPRGCIETTSAIISQPEALTVDAGEDVTIDLGYSTDFQTTTTPFLRPVEYVWTEIAYLDCMDCPDPTAKPPTTTPFVVTISDQTNCTASDTVTVYVNTNRPIFIPNAFSPNFDGNNDRFTIYSGPAAIEINELLILDRWGNLIYNDFNIPINDQRFGWDGFFDGKEMPPGVYTYVAKILYIDDVIETYGGDITLVK